MEMEQNTSGQGASSVVPEEVKGWSWAAFLMSWIWGIGNQVWLALLMFVPCVNIVMWFVLGVKGNEWAWQNRKWESVEQFKTVQRIWVKWGVILLIISVVLGIIAVVLSSIIAMQATKSQMQMNF